MADSHNTQVDDTATGAGQPPVRHSLRSGAIGLVGVVVMVVAVAAPIQALTSNFALSLGSGVGPATVGVVVLVVAILAIFTAGYAALSRVVVNAGAYYAYVAYGLGRNVGAATAFVAAVGYNAGAAGMAAATGYFTDLAFTNYLGFSMPWWIYTAAALALIALLSGAGVSLAAMVTTVICGLQFILLITLVVAVLVRNPAGFTLGVFSPPAVFSGGLGLSLVFALLSFAGFDAAAVYGEESRDRRRNVARATYLAVLLLGILFVLSIWAIVAAVPDVQAVAQASPGELVFGVFATYLGQWTGPVLGFLVAGSFLGATVALHNLAARYMFALGRATLLPAPLARTGARRQAPHVAVGVQIALSVAVVVPFAVAEIDPLVGLFPAISGITSLALVVIMSACSASVVAAAVRHRITGSRWSTMIAPVIACAALLTCGGIIAARYTEITGSESTWINALPITLIVAATYGALAQHRRDPTSLDVDEMAK